MCFPGCCFSYVIHGNIINQFKKDWFKNHSYKLNKDLLWSVSGDRIDTYQMTAYKCFL